MSQAQIKLTKSPSRWGPFSFMLGCEMCPDMSKDHSFVWYPSPISLETEDGTVWNKSLLHESSPPKPFGTYQALSIPHLSPQPPLPAAAAPLIQMPHWSLQDPY